MKFIFSRSLTENPFIKNLLNLYLLGILSFAALNIFLEHHNWGLLPSQIMTHVVGNAELFIRPAGIEDRVVDIHIRMFLALINLLTLGAIFFRLPISEKQKLIILACGFFLALVDSWSLLFLPFAPQPLAWLKFFGFFGYEVILIWLTTSCLWLLNFKGYK